MEIDETKGKIGWVDSLHFDHHIGEDINAVPIYASEELCRENQTCIDTDGHCTAMRVLVIQYPE